MGLDIISIGNKVEIIESSAVRNGITDEKVNPPLVSQVYNVIDDDHLQIEMPFRGTKIVLLEPVIRYQICIYTPHGLFKCNVQVTDRFKQENRYIANIELKSSLKRVQRREYFRLEKLFEIEYRKLTEEETEMTNVDEILKSEDLMSEYKPAIAVDLSGGGTRLVMNEKFEIGQMLMISFKLAEGKTINFVASTVSSTPMKTDTSQYENRVKFIKLRESQREELIRYIFEEERKMRFKGKS